MVSIQGAFKRALGFRTVRSRCQLGRASLKPKPKTSNPETPKPVKAPNPQHCLKQEDSERKESKL